MDYSGNGRSNYVHFTDKEKVEKILEFYQLIMQSNEKGDCILVGYDNESGDINSYAFVSVDFDESYKELKEYGLVDIPFEEFEMGDQYELPDFFTVISKYLPEGEVLVWQATGNEGLRYLNGYSVAVNSKGQTAVVNINDIFEKVNELGMGTATGAEY